MLLSFRSLGAWWPALALFLCAPAGAEELFSTLAGYAAHNCAEGSYFWDASRFGDPRFTDRFEMAADDFVVPAEVDGWRVRRIDVRGEVEDDWGGLPASLSVYVLGDVDGAPESIDLAGAAIYFATEVPYVEPERGDFLISPATARCCPRAGTGWSCGPTPRSTSTRCTGSGRRAAAASSTRTAGSSRSACSAPEP